MSAAIKKAFVAQLLAPLPSGVEQVEDKAFCRDLIVDMKAVWHKALLLYNSETHADLAQTIRRNRDDNSERLHWTDICKTPRWAAGDALFRTPAPSIGAINWKRKRLTFGGGHPDWEGLIEADVTRLRSFGVKL